MAYATQADLEQRFGSEELIKLTDRSTPPTGQIDATVIARALADAESEINGYLAARYPLPLAQVPTVLTKLACDISRYLLHDDYATEAVRARYDDAVRILSAISQGKVSLGLDTGGASVSEDAKAEGRTADKKFSRDTLEGY